MTNANEENDLKDFSNLNIFVFKFENYRGEKVLKKDDVLQLD